MVSNDTISTMIISPYGIIVNGDYIKFQRIYDLRIDKDKTQKDIARLLFITQQQYSLYEKGYRDIPSENVLRK